MGNGLFACVCCAGNKVTILATISRVSNVRYVYDCMIYMFKHIQQHAILNGNVYYICLHSELRAFEWIISLLWRAVLLESVCCCEHFSEISVSCGVETRASSCVSHPPWFIYDFVADVFPPPQPSTSIPMWLLGSEPGSSTVWGYVSGHINFIPGMEPTNNTVYWIQDVTMFFILLWETINMLHKPSAVFLTV